MTAARPHVYANIFRRLAQKELILPAFENAMLADNWPESYNIVIDSGVYYGKGDGYFHPSTHAMMGARELYYRFHPATRDKVLTQKPSLQSQMALSVGTALHGVIQTQMQMAGLVKPENVEWEYINEDHHVRGRIDFVVDHPNGQTIPVEFKTCNPHVFAKLDSAKPAWEAQLCIGLDNFGAEFGIVLALETAYPYKMKEFRVPRNDTLLSEIYQKFDLVREAIELDRPPKYCCSYDSLTMKSCNARLACYLAENVDD